MRLKPCLIAGCHALADGPRCPPHEREYQRLRSRGRTWYHGDWQALRKKRRGVCIRCGNVGPTELDHIQPRSRSGGVRELCPPCHREIGRKFAT